MSDLDTLRPEIRDAVDSLDKSEGIDFAWLAVRAEMLRLARESDEWQTRCLRFQTERDMARAELAALKARIAEAPVAYLTSKTGVGPCNVASMAHGVVFDSSSYGKSVRVVLDE